MKRNLFQLFCIRQRSRITAACVLLLVLLTYTNTASRADAALPEFYGVYVKDRGKLIELGPTTLEKDRRNFSGSLNIIYFGEPLMMPGIELHRRAFVRSQIEYLVDKPEQKPKEVSVKRVEDFLVLKEELRLRFKPVREQPGMVIAVPEQTLVPGLYTVIILGGKEGGAFPFAVGLDNTPEKDSPYNNCLDEYVTSIDPGGKFSWNKWFALTQCIDPFTGRRVNGNLVLESSYKPCSVLDQMVIDWRMATLSALDQERWEDATTGTRQVLAVNPGDNELSSLVHNRLMSAALQALDHKDWGTVISFATKALEIQPGEQQATALLQQAKQTQVASERSVIIAALQSSDSFFGAEKSSDKKEYPFKITFESFDEHSSRILGKMDYYSPDDKAILCFEGFLTGSALRLQHTGVVRKGGSTPNFQYTLSLGQDGILKGEYMKSGSKEKLGSAWIDLNEERRKAKEISVSEIVRKEKIREESCTPTKVIATIIEKPDFNKRHNKITLTDVSIQGIRGRNEVPFIRITAVDKVGYSGKWRIVIEMPSESGPYKAWLDIEFQKNKEECDAFYDTLMNVWEAWKKKYAEILISETRNDEEFAPEYKQGILYAKNGQYEKAIAEWLKALEKDNENIKIYYNLGIAYTKVGKLDDAIAVWQKALTINPLLANLHYSIGLAYKEKGNFELAETSLKKTIEIDPNYSNAKNVLEELTSTKHSISE